MKKKIILGLSLTVIAIATCVIANSCSKLAKINCPTSSMPYYCALAEKCCSYPYYANGYCYKTYSDCKASGHSCMTCTK